MTDNSDLRFNTRIAALGRLVKGELRDSLAQLDGALRNIDDIEASGASTERKLAAIEAQYEVAKGHERRLKEIEKDVITLARLMFERYGAKAPMQPRGEPW